MISTSSLYTNLIMCYPKDTIPKESTQMPLQNKKWNSMGCLQYNLATTLSTNLQKRYLSKQFISNKYLNGLRLNPNW